MGWGRKLGGRPLLSCLPSPSAHSPPCVSPHLPSRSSADAEKRQLAGVIEGLQRELDGLRRELAARDATLVDKERRIAELAGKTQVWQGWLNRGQG